MRTIQYAFNNPLLLVVTILVFTITSLVTTDTINADRGGHKLFKQNNGGQVLARNQRTKVPSSRKVPLFRPGQPPHHGATRYSGKNKATHLLSPELPGTNIAQKLHAHCRS